MNSDEIFERRDLFNKIIVGYTVNSQRLFDIYSVIPDYPCPTLLTENGVDLSIFKPNNLERYQKNGNKPLVIGWAGNSKWAADKEDFKGFHSILMPAIEQLKFEGLNLETCFADRQEGFIPHVEMPDYYSKIDIYVCPSKIEGTPNPIMEAMACGVPIITTDVGVVPQVFGDLQKNFIVAERTVDAFVVKLRDLYHKRQVLLGQLSSENLQSIKAWDWSIKVKNYAHFFDVILAKR